MIQWFILSLFGLGLIAGGLAPVWLLRGVVQQRARPAQLRLGLVAWVVETLALFFGLLLALGFLWIPAVVDTATGTPRPGAANEQLLLFLQEVALVISLLGALAVLAGVWGVPTPADIGLASRGPTRRYALRDTLFGLALGPLAVGVFLVAGLIGGWNHIVGLAPLPDLLGSLVGGAVLFLFVGIFEEVSGRGCLFALLGRVLGLPAAWVISVVIFGLAHGGNPGATLYALAGVALAGVVFAVALLRSGALWLPITFHWSWNWAEGPLYGYPVSGTGLGSALQLQIDAQAPAWATGSVFGPEASAFVIFALALALGAIWLYTRNRAGQAALFPAGAPERGMRNEE